MRSPAVVVLSVASWCSLFGQTYGIATYAGGLNNLGATAYDTVRAVAVDGSGNVFIALPDLHLVAELDVTGALTRVAGNGTAGYSGDGAPRSMPSYLTRTASRLTRPAIFISPIRELPAYTLPAGNHTATLEITAPVVSQTVHYELESNRWLKPKAAKPRL
jgi:hypothetical protein